MKGNNSAMLRAMYIILVPVVILIILLNSGWLQRLLPAATVNGESYNVVRYNYYYFDYYNSFLTEHEDELDTLGYDPEVAGSKQSYDSSMTWKEFFQRQGEANLAETAYYCALAQAAGYEFSAEELAPVAQKLAEQEAERTQYGISADNYYLSYYGAGMNQERFREELTRQVQARAYKAHLTATYEPEQAQLDAWLADHPGTDYSAASLRVITLEALPDRATGEVGEEQLEALASKLSKLARRYESGTDFAALQAAFSTCALGDDSGALTDATALDLPHCLSQWCLESQDALTAGETYACIDEDTGLAYFAVLDGLGSSGRALEGRAALAAVAVEEQGGEIIATDYTVERSTIGMLLATT